MKVIMHTPYILMSFYSYALDIGMAASNSCLPVLTPSLPAGVMAPGLWRSWTTWPLAPAASKPLKVTPPCVVVPLLPPTLQHPVLQLPLLPYTARRNSAGSPVRSLSFLPFGNTHSPSFLYSYSFAPSGGTLQEAPTESSSFPQLPSSLL